MNREQDRHHSSLRTSVLRAGALLVLACGLLAGPAWAQHFESMEYYHYDALGSVRLVVSYPHDSMTYTISRHDYLPFGEEIQPGTFGRARNLGYGTGDTTPQRFTAKERDPESNLDYFGARYYSGAQGRWTSADKPFADQQAADPQSWNLYGYVRNNPLGYVDPDGKSPTLVTGGVGFLIGVVAGAVGSTGAQFIRNGYSFKNFNVQDVGAAAAGGGVSGFLAGVTLGGSLIVQGAAGVAVVGGVGAASNVAGGAVTRALDSPEAGTSVIDGDAALVDAVAGGLGGVAGNQVGNMVRAPVQQMERTAAGMVPAARAGNYAAAKGIKTLAAGVAAKERAAQAVDAVVGSKATNVVVPAWQASRERREKEKETSQ